MIFCGMGFQPCRVSRLFGDEMLSGREMTGWKPIPPFFTASKRCGTGPPSYRVTRRAVLSARRLRVVSVTTNSSKSKARRRWSRPHCRHQRLFHLPFLGAFVPWWSIEPNGLDAACRMTAMELQQIRNRRLEPHDLAGCDFRGRFAGVLNCDGEEVLVGWFVARTSFRRKTASGSPRRRFPLRRESCLRMAGRPASSPPGASCRDDRFALKAYRP